MFKSLTVLLATIVAAAFAPAGYGAPVVYLQTFANTTNGNLSSSSYGWEAYRTSNAGGVENVTGNSGAVGSSASAGATNPTSVNATLPGSETVSGRIFMSKSNQDSGAWAAYTNTAETATINNAFTGKLEDVASFAFEHGHSSAGITLRLLVQVADEWYVSTDAYTNNIGGSANFPDDAEGVTHTLTGGDEWFAVAFNPASSMGTIDTTAVALTGDVQAYGVYGNWGSSGDTTARFDNFTINAIPEPASLALMGLGGMLVLGRGRRA